MDTKLFTKLTEVERYFTGTKYDSIVKRAVEMFEKGDESGTKGMLKNLPSREFLLAKVLEELRKKGKRTYRTLVENQMLRDESEPGHGAEFLQGLFSLGTHVLIQMKNEGKEYGILLPLVYERIGKVLIEQGL